MDEEGIPERIDRLVRAVQLQLQAREVLLQDDLVQDELAKLINLLLDIERSTYVEAYPHLVGAAEVAIAALFSKPANQKLAFQILGISKNVSVAGSLCS